MIPTRASRISALVIWTLLVSGCFSPDIPVTMCGPDGACPPGATCSSSNVCRPDGQTEDWFDTRWPFRQEVELPEDTPRATVVLLSDPDMLSETTVDGRDLRFVDDDGVLVPHEIEVWNPDDGSVVWINTQGVALPVLLYWGNQDAEDAQDPELVWAGYEGVWHLADQGIQSNSASTELDGQPLGSITSAEGAVGGGLQLTPNTESALEILGTETLFDGAEAVTVELWLFPDYPDSSPLRNAPGTFLDSSGNAIRNGRAFFGAELPANQIHIQIDFFFDVAGGVFRRATAEVGRWSHLAYVYDGSNLIVYLDGIQVDIVAVPGDQISTGSSIIRLGHQLNPFSGILDEVRVRRTIVPQQQLLDSVDQIVNSPIELGPIEPLF